MINLKKFLTAICVCFILFAAYIISLPAPQGVMILEYHTITDAPDEDAKKYSITPKDFREQLQYLKDNGYETISMRDFMLAKKGKLPLPPKPIILTFDDGYEDNYSTLLPMLEEFGMKATVYMITNNIGKKGYLTLEQLKDMEKRGVEIGSHTANHIPLTELSTEKQAEEIKLSKLGLEWKGLKTIYTFSYPNGAYNDNLPSLLKENEYLTAVTGEPGINDFNTNPFLLHRTHIIKPTFGLLEFRYRLLKSEIYAKLGLYNKTNTYERREI